MKKIKAYDIETNELIGEYNTQQEVADAFDLTWEAVKSYFYREKIYGEARILNHNTDTWCYLVKEEEGKSINYKERCLNAIEYIKTHSEMTDLQIYGIENVLAFRGSATKLLEILGADDENNR